MIALLLRYVLSALTAFVAGLLTAASLHSINTRVVNSTLLYDIVLVAVIGGITQVLPPTHSSAGAYALTLLHKTVVGWRGATR